jgi:hypothetical protein
LKDLLRDFFVEHAEKKLAKKTIERYREQAAYLHSDLLAMPVSEIKPLHLEKEWNRLLESGGRLRTSGLQRPLAAKTVRNIEAVLSSAFCSGNQMGRGCLQSRCAKRASRAETKERRSTDTGPTEIADRLGHRLLVSARVP